MTDNIDAVISNGFIIDKTANHLNLGPHDREKYALSPQKGYRCIDKTNFKPNQELLPDTVSSVFTSPQLLTHEECRQWIDRAEAAKFDEGDFIFKTGKSGHERMETGGRRSSATMLVNDQSFSLKMTANLKGSIPEVLSDGRKFVGIRDTFLVSKYGAGQYFAPHFDGNTTAIDELTGISTQSAFTAVLYLSEDFTGGSTHYLPGPGSEVMSPIAVRPPIGHAVIHKAVTILHAGGEITSGTK